MSDDFSSLGQPEGVASSDQPLLLEALVEQTAGSAGGRKRLALIVGLLAVLGGALFAAFSLLSDQQNTPAEGASSFMESLAAEDLLGASENLLPGERRILAEPLFAWIDQAERLGILSDVNKSALQGFDLEIADLTYETEEIADGLSWVSISGDITGAIRPEDLPLGGLLTGYLPENYLDDLPSQVAEDTELDEDFGFVLVKEDGTWYVSLLHTVAEIARRGNGVEFDDRQLINEPGGANTPAEALELFVLAATEFDVRGVLDVLDPDETAAFRRYSPLFLPDWDISLADFRSEMTAAGVVFRVDKVTTEAAGEGNDQVAWITGIPKFELAIEVPGLGSNGIKSDDGCLTVRIDESLSGALGSTAGIPAIDFSRLDGETCLDGLGGADLFGLTAQGSPYMSDDQIEIVRQLPVVGPIVDQFSEHDFAERPQIEFEITERDGRYFVSLSGSVNRWLTAASGLLDEDLLTAVGDDIQDLADDPGAALEQLMPALLKLDSSGIFSRMAMGAAGAVLPISEEVTVATEVTEYGADALASYANTPGLLVVWDYDLAYVVSQIEEIYGPDIVTGTITGAELRAYFLEAFGPDGDFGLSDDEFPSGIKIASIDVDTLVEIFDWEEVVELYTLEDVGIID